MSGFLLDRLDGVELRLHSPTPREVVMVCDAAWEGSGCGYATVFRDGPIMRMYYLAADLTSADGAKMAARPVFACYAESPDGIRWVKPDLGLFEYGGAKHNNIIWSGLSRWVQQRVGAENLVAGNGRLGRSPVAARGDDQSHLGGHRTGGEREGSSMNPYANYRRRLQTGAESHPRHPRRQTQRFPLRCPDEGAGHFYRTGQPDVPCRLPEGCAGKCQFCNCERVG